jgi:hypothetical protein
MAHYNSGSKVIITQLEHWDNSLRHHVCHGLGPADTLIQLYPRGFTNRVKRPERGAEYYVR